MVISSESLFLKKMKNSVDEFFVFFVFHKFFVVVSETIFSKRGFGDYPMQADFVKRFALQNLCLRPSTEVRCFYQFLSKSNIFLELKNIKNQKKYFSRKVTKWETDLPNFSV